MLELFAEDLDELDQNRSCTPKCFLQLLIPIALCNGLDRHVTIYDPPLV